MSPTQTPNEQTLPRPVGRWLRVLDLEQPTLADASLDDAGSVTAIHCVLINGNPLTWEADPEEATLNAVHDQLNRGKWEDLGEPPRRS